MRFLIRCKNSIIHKCTFIFNLARTFLFSVFFSFFCVLLLLCFLANLGNITQTPKMEGLRVLEKRLAIMFSTLSLKLIFITLIIKFNFIQFLFKFKTSKIQLLDFWQNYFTRWGLRYRLMPLLVFQRNFHLPFTEKIKNIHISTFWIFFLRRHQLVCQRSYCFWVKRNCRILSLLNRK